MLIHQKVEFILDYEDYIESAKKYQRKSACAYQEWLESGDLLDLEASGYFGLDARENLLIAIELKKLESH